ncbi:MAG TPA: class I SAM-dependent methyltransferase, partial [Gemmatimonadaceae bacterium]
VLAAVGAGHARLVHDRRVRTIAATLTRVMLLRDALRGDTTRAQVFLDVGCGDGRVAALVAAHTGRAVMGVDPLPRENAVISVAAFDGEHLPFPDDSVAYVTLSDVLHHADDPVALLREGLRVSRHGVILKDHLVRHRGDGLVLRAMDWAGNAPHGVRLVYRYWTEREWWEMAEGSGARVTHWERLRDLYAAPIDWVCGRHLHVVLVMERALVPVPNEAGDQSSIAVR